MKESQKKNAYCAPRLKVVAFQIEQGFQGSPTEDKFTLTSSRDNIVEGANWSSAQEGDWFPRGTGSGN